MAYRLLALTFALAACHDATGHDVATADGSPGGGPAADASPTSNTAACAATAGFAATASSTEIALAWTAVPGVAGTIERKTYCGSDDYVTVGSAAAGSAAMVDDTVQPNYVYWYRLTSADGAGGRAQAAAAVQATSGTGSIGCAGGASPQASEVTDTCRAGSDAGVPDAGMTNGHGAVRGRPHIANGTLVADDGSLLRMVHTYVHDFALPYNADPTWWKEMHDIGHFNTVRVMAFLGSWPNSTQTMDVARLLPRLDTLVQLASESGMYLVIDNHSECCGAMNATNDTAFWNAVAARYKDNTNVIYELKNEPYYFDEAGLAAFENQQYALIRAAAPETHIIAWTISQPTDIASTIMAMFAMGKIDYANASIGLHPYNYGGNLPALLALYKTIQAKYPIVMTELAAGASGAPDISFLNTLEGMTISWSFLSFGFYDLDNDTAYGDPAFLMNGEGAIHIFYPED